jgi:hypothetical protein
MSIGPSTKLHYAANGVFDDDVYTPGVDGFNLADVSSVSVLNALPAGMQGLVYLGMTGGVTSAFVSAVDAFLGNSRVFGFYLADEPDPSVVSAANLKAESDYIHAHFPGAKTFIVEYNETSDTNPTYAFTPANTDIDLFGLDPYPVNTNVPNNLDYQIIPAAVDEALSIGIPRADIVPVYQTFGGGGYATYLLPTAAQESQILSTWGSVVPDPVFDYAYSWGVQDDDTALSNDPTLAAVMAAHNVASSLSASELSGAIFFQNTNGTIAVWNVEGDANAGGPTFANPGSVWTLLGVGNFYGDLEPDILFQNTSGEYALWRSNGAEIIGGGVIGDPNSTWAFKAIGDFNGDGFSDLLFEDASGNYATWDMNGTSIVGGGVIGNPGSGWTFEAVADFNGDGTSDLLFENASGMYAIWEIGDNRVIGGGLVGAPGPSWTFKGAGDFSGNGDADLLFENASGTYAAWDLNGSAIVGGGVIGSPGSNWIYQGIADLTGNQRDSILFLNTATGQYATWEMNGSTILGGASFGAAGSSWTEKAFV